MGVNLIEKPAIITFTGQRAEQARVLFGSAQRCIPLQPDTDTYNHRFWRMGIHIRSAILNS
jgi:hypothetical protein